jgi:hypothetical protein
LYYYEPSTASYTVEEEPSPYVEYFTYNEETHSYEVYEPTQVEWTAVYEQPSTQLYSFESATQSFVVESEPSPYQTYYYYQPSTQTYEEYVPTAPEWTNHYEEPSV